jgi:putative protease
MGEKEIGEVSTYFSHVEVAAIKLSGTVKIGDKIHIVGHTTDLQQKVKSMQIENKKVTEGRKGNHVGIKVEDKVRPHDKVFLVE